MPTRIGTSESWWKDAAPRCRRAITRPALCVAALVLGCNPDDGAPSPGSPDDPGGTVHVDPSAFDAGGIPPDSGGVPPDTGGGYETGLPESAPADGPVPDPRCTGTATPCSLIGNALCETALGCSIDGDCSGYPGSCYAQYSSYACNAIDGCYWSYSTDKCSGSARSCGSYYSEYSCISQHNCSWDDDCTGVPVPCSSLAVEECLSQPGCSVEYE